MVAGERHFVACHAANQEGDDIMILAQPNTQSPRWGTRKEAMVHGRVGATTLNHLMRDGRIRAKKLDGRKVLIDLHSIDRLYAALPDVGSAQ
jgi:hypothetical protein